MLASSSATESRIRSRWIATSSNSLRWGPARKTMTGWPRHVGCLSSLSTSQDGNYVGAHFDLQGLIGCFPTSGSPAGSGCFLVFCWHPRNLCTCHSLAPCRTLCLNHCPESLSRQAEKNLTKSQPWRLMSRNCPVRNTTKDILECGRSWCCFYNICTCVARAHTHISMEARGQHWVFASISLYIIYF